MLFHGVKSLWTRPRLCRCRIPALCPSNRKSLRLACESRSFGGQILAYDIWVHSIHKGIFVLCKVEPCELALAYAAIVVLGNGLMKALLKDIGHFNLFEHLLTDLNNVR